MVTDADRRAAASIAVLPEMRELILAGKADHHAEAFAEHRLDATQALVDAHEALIERANALAEALHGWLNWLSFAACADEGDPAYPNGEGCEVVEEHGRRSMSALADYTAWMIDG